MKKSERIAQLEKQVAELQREIAIIKGTKEVSYPLPVFPQSPFKTPPWNVPYEYPKTIPDKEFWMRYPDGTGTYPLRTPYIT